MSASYTKRQFGLIRLNWLQKEREKKHSIYIIHTQMPTVKHTDEGKSENLKPL